MKRLLTLLLVVVLVLGMTSSALAKGPGKPVGSGAGKANLYNSDACTCSEGALDLAGKVSGFVVMNTNRAGDLIVTVSLKRATPNVLYDIWVNQDPGACPLGAPTVVGAVRTNRMGNGNGFVKIPKVAGATQFWVSVVGGGLVLRSTAVQLD